LFILSKLFVNSVFFEANSMSGNQDEQARGMALIAAIMLSAILFFGYLTWSAAR